MTSTFIGVGEGEAKMSVLECPSECFGRPVFIFLLKKIGFAPSTGIMLSQTLIDYWQEIFPLSLVSGSEAIL